VPAREHLRMAVAPCGQCGYVKGFRWVYMGRKGLTSAPETQSAPQCWCSCTGESPGGTSVRLV
jgi:hypothetical protein